MEHAVHSQDELISQVRWLSDRAAIQDLISAFARAIDTKDWDGYAALFTKDGAAVMPCEGRTPESPAADESRNSRVALDAVWQSSAAGELDT